MKQILPYINTLIYQYGFNGKENDGEVSGVRNGTTFHSNVGGGFGTVGSSREGVRTSFFKEYSNAIKFPDGERKPDK